MLSDRADNQSTLTSTKPAAPDRLLPIREVQLQCGMGKTAIYAGVLDRTFPAPAKIGKSSRWLQSEIQLFIAGKAAARTLP